VDAVVHGVAGGDEVETRYVPSGGVIGVGVPEIDHHQRLPFEFEGVAFQYLGSDKCLRDLSGEPGLPERREEIQGHLRSGLFDDLRGRHRLHAPGKRPRSVANPNQ
jgi:hypothetical protein